MKKGDIVVLKDPEMHSLKDAYYTMGSVSGDVLKFLHRSNYPTELTVSEVGTIAACCTVYPTVQFEELGRVVFAAELFSVVLEAGEPDVEKLMRESKELAMATIGF